MTHDHARTTLAETCADPPPTLAEAEDEGTAAEARAWLLALRCPGCRSRRVRYEVGWQPVGLWAECQRCRHREEM